MWSVTYLFAISLISTLALGQSTIADRVYGQGGVFTTNLQNKGGISASSLFWPSDVVGDGSGGIYVSDSYNNRVLHYSSGSTNADRVLGQSGSLVTGARGASQSQLNDPNGLSLDASGGLYVADYGNHRVLHFSVGSVFADRVYGQPSYTSSSPGSGARGLNYPIGVTADVDGGLYVADQSNHRVLHFPSGSTTADRVYGQFGSFSANVLNNGGVSADSLNWPTGVAVDGSNLYIADYGNHRVLHFTGSSTTADEVYGQSGSFATNSPNQGGISAASLNAPIRVSPDGDGGIYIVEENNNRVLHFQARSTTADRVFGQNGSFTAIADAGGSANATSLSNPWALFRTNEGALYIADYRNSRVLYYPASATETSIGSISSSPAFVNTPYKVFFSVTSLYPGIPTGTVTVSDGSGATCSGFAPAGSCWLMSTTAGTKTISISYSGDLVYNPSFGTSSLVVTAPALTTVPDLSGLTQIQVVSALTNAGLSVGIVKTSTSPNVVAGSVISQSPPPGSLVNPGSQVNIIVSGPQVINASPSSGSGAGQTFAFTFTQSGEYTKLNVVNVLINNVVDGRGACYLAYVISTNTLYLVNDAGDGGGPFAGGMLMTGTGSVGNSQCTIQGSGSSAVGSGNSLTLTLSIIFSQAFAGNKILYAAARDTSNNNTGWQAAGVWRTPEPASTGPAVAGVSPARSTAASETFTFIFIDTNGWQDIAVANVLINSAIDGRNACYVAVVPSSATTGSVYLVDDGGNAGGPYSGLSILGNATAANSQCSITAAGSSIAASSNSLTVTLAITFGEHFTGNRVIYQAVRNAFLNSGWQSSGILSR